MQRVARSYPRSHLVACCAFLLAGALPAEAQVARGTVRDEVGQPVRTALVLLLDSAGVQRTAALTDTAGNFTVRAPAAGRYHLRVERIGYRSTSDPVAVELRVGEAVVRTLVTSALPVALPALTAAAQRRCTSRPAEGEAVATLWYEVRKGLQASQLGGASQQYSFRNRHFVRWLDVPYLRVQADTASVRVEHARGSPFVSAPAAELIERGFIQVTDTGTIYFAPDANVLLSDEFADAYCLTPVEDVAGQRVGIRFRPVARAGPAAVTGTLWLDRGSLELRQLVYGYTRTALPQGPVEQVGGQLEFERLPDGSWIVRRWYIRVPVVAERSAFMAGGAPVRTRVITGIREGGAEVLEVLDRRGQPVPLDTLKQRNPGSR